MSVKLHFRMQSNHTNTFRTKEAGISSKIIAKQWGGDSIYGHPAGSNVVHMGPNKGSKTSNLFYFYFQLPPESSMNCFVTGKEGKGAQMVRFWNNSECASPIWTKIGTTKQLDTKNKPVMYFLKILKIDPTRRGQRSKFYLILTRNHVLTCHSDSAGPMWTKIGKVKQLDPGNKHLAAFLQNLRI